MATTSGEFTVECKIEKEAGGYSSVCEKLGVASCGDNIDEALENLAEAIDLHLDTLKDIGQLDQFLKEKGVTLVVDNSWVKQGISVTTDDARRDENSYVWPQLQSPGCGRGWTVHGEDAELSYELREILTEQVVLV